MQENALFSGKIYTAGTNFTRPLVATVVTNLNSDALRCSSCTLQVLGSDFLESWSSYIFGWTTKKQATKGENKLPAYIHRWCFHRLQGPGSDSRLLPTLPKSNNRQSRTFSKILKVKAWKSSFPGSESHHTTLKFSESVDISLKGVNESKTPDASCI